MYSDTHFHFEHTTNRNNGENPVNGTEILEEMAKRNCFFGLDIGTESDDLLRRQACLDNAIAQIKDTRLAEKARKFVYFSAAIWPSPEEITNRHESMKILKQQIETAENSGDNDTLNRKIIAIGECGLDHHWNPSGIDGRCESDFNQKMYDAERELFEMQLELAKELDLPFIVHSRDGFEDTVDVLRSANYNRGIIHCFSYGLSEAKTFLDLGWYLAFGGATTYTKKAKMDEFIQLLQYVPKDRILLETDSPYLAPVPMRGSENNPLFIKYTYEFISEKIGLSVDKLNKIVDDNCSELFGLKK